MTVATTELGGEIVEREIPRVGLLRFENFAAGQWLTQKGAPAKKAKRVYTLNGVEQDAVSSIVGTLSADALIAWAEDHGARGAVQAERMGELVDVPEEDIIRRVRSLGLGADAARDDAGDRGTAIHLAMHTLATTGEAPNLGDYPGVWRPWVQGAVRAWLALDPEPIDSEFMVCNPDQGYAGRPDFFCLSDGLRTLVDYKTGKGKVYDRAHYQTRGYAEAFPPCGLEPPQRIVILGIGDDGGFQIVDCSATADDWDALLHTYRARKRINAAMAEARKAAKAAA